MLSDYLGPAQARPNHFHQRGACRRSEMTSTRPAASNIVLNVLFVVGLTWLILVLAATLLPPQSGHSESRGRGGAAPSASRD